jgi:hypothetical protein
LNHSESLVGAVLQVGFRFFTIEAVKKFPSRVREVKKRRAVFVGDESFVVAYAKIVRMGNEAVDRGDEKRQKKNRREILPFVSIRMMPDLHI